LLDSALWFHTQMLEVKVGKMLEFVVDVIFVVVGGRVFGQSVGVPMCADCVPLLADICLCVHVGRSLIGGFCVGGGGLLLWPSILHFDMLIMFCLLMAVGTARTSVRPGGLEVKDAKECSTHIWLVFRYIIGIRY
jgi:hypothetical protein